MLLLSIDDHRFLQLLFNGYVNCYRRFQWHTTGNYADMTAADLRFFDDLGNSLGFLVRREGPRWQRDLCWCESVKKRDDIESRTTLYIERENLDRRAMGTIKKMLCPENSQNIPFLVAVFGWVRPFTLQCAKEKIREGLGANQRFLLISWIAEKRDSDGDVEGWVYSKQHEYWCRVTPKIDSAGYWYIDGAPGSWNWYSSVEPSQIGAIS